MAFILYNVIITPLETLFDWIFNFVHFSFPKIGIIGAIAFLSLFVNLLALPLYNMADRIQEKERKTVRGMQKWVSHIKRTFKGDERFMMLSELYRQNNYHPIYALRSTLSILIQIPFFIAAYHYLRSNELLQGASFFCFKDLSAPDSLISLKFAGFAFSLNTLPFVMTAVNLFSGSLYSKDFTAREKFQIYALALVFLVLLYNSPSGLVIYWTFNNLFSLAKNFVKKNLKNPRVLLLSFGVLLILFVHCISSHRFGYKKKTLLLFAYGLTCFAFIYPKLLKYRRFQIFVKQIFLLFAEIKKNALILSKKIYEYVPKSFKELPSPSFSLLFFSGISLSVLCGLVLPSSAIATSPIEFSFLGEISSPIFYIKTAFCVCVGFFLFWPIAIYKLSGQKIRFAIPIVWFSLAICALFNAYVFKCDWGNLDVSFNLSSLDILNISNPLYKLMPLEILLVVALSVLVAQKKRRIGVVTALIFAVCLGMTVFSFTKIKRINKDFAEYALNLEKYGSKGLLEGGIEKVYHFSKTQKNVLVLFLDRGVGPFVKGIFEEYPEIKEKFDGFTWYPNTLSYSNCTVTGSLPLYGGYEYTQEEINKRSFELLRDKNNEAQLLMPKLFLDAGFTATVTDPCWPNFKWEGDLSAYEKLPDVVAREFEKKLFNNYMKEKGLAYYNDAGKTCQKQIVNFSILQALYPTFRKTFYKRARAVQGLPEGAKGWLGRFSHLYYLDKYTDFDAKKGAFINMHSMAAHDVFTPAKDLETPASENDRDWNGRTHYLADAAAFKQYGKYFDLLKENGCYDNTRIIIVSDHAWRGGENNPCFDGFENPKKNDAIYLNAMLLVKDFDCHGEVKTDNTFMTNADTLFLAKDGLGVSDTNPFTGKKLVPQKDGGVNIYWCYDWNAANFQEATQFQLTENLNWHVSDNIFEQKNWIPLIEWKKHHGGEE